MVELEFNYQQDKTIIQANINDPFMEIINKFINKKKLNLNNIYFLSNGKNLNKNEIVNNIMSSAEKKNKKMIILVYNINTTIKLDNTNIIKSNDIICPRCKETCKFFFDVDHQRISLYDCKNRHKTENIKIKEFDNTQKIDLSKIRCGKCKNKNKAETFNNEFYFCFKCKMNLSPLCKLTHDKTHIITDYDNKKYICSKHNEIFFKYCEDCKIDLCLSCTNEHKNHEVQII